MEDTSHRKLPHGRLGITSLALTVMGLAVVIWADFRADEFTYTDTYGDMNFAVLMGLIFFVQIMFIGAAVMAVAAIIGLVALFRRKTDPAFAYCSLAINGIFVLYVVVEIYA